MNFLRNNLLAVISIVILLVVWGWMGWMILFKPPSLISMSLDCHLSREGSIDQKGDWIYRYPQLTSQEADTCRQIIKARDIERDAEIPVDLKKLKKHLKNWTP